MSSFRVFGVFRGSLLFRRQERVCGRRSTISSYRQHVDGLEEIELAVSVVSARNINAT